MAGEQKPSCNLLEQFILLAKGTNGSALTVLINQVLEAPGVYVFGELLELTNVQEVRVKLPSLFFFPSPSPAPFWFKSSPRNFLAHSRLGWQNLHLGKSLT